MVLGGEEIGKSLMWGWGVVMGGMGKCCRSSLGRFGERKGGKVGRR